MEMIAVTLFIQSVGIFRNRRLLLRFYILSLTYCEFVRAEISEVVTSFSFILLNCRAVFSLLNQLIVEVMQNVYALQ